MRSIELISGTLSVAMGMEKVKLKGLVKGEQIQLVQEMMQEKQVVTEVAKEEEMAVGSNRGGCKS
jgi:hypothetical protein